MYPAQSMYSYFKRRYSPHLLREDNVPSPVDQRTPFAQTWTKLSRNYLQSMWSPNNQLSVTVVNDEILTSGFLKNSSTKSKNVSYTLQEEKFLLDLKQKYSKDYIESMVPDSVWECASKMDHMQDWHIVDDPNIKIRNDVNIIKNSTLCDAYENNSTMESHFMQVNKTEKMRDNMTDTSDFSNVDPRKHEDDIHKDTDVESFLVVSHSDVPVVPVNFENPISSISDVCRNVWNRFTSRLYCKTKSARMSIKRPLYPTKQHHRRKANTIAMGRGRGRAKGQLRRSGVSQTIRRKECKYEDYEIWQNNLVGKSNNCSLNSKFDNMDIPNSAQVTKQIDSLTISNSSRTTSTKGKPKARKKKKTKIKYVNKVRYIPTSSRINDYCESSNSKISDAQEGSSQSRTLSECSADVEDEWIVFEDDDVEKLPETREKRGATEYPIGTRYVSNSSIRKNDSSYEDSNYEIHDAEKISFRLRSSSESSTDSEDSNHSSTVLDEQEECPRNHNRLTKISEDFNSQKQKNSFQHRRLLSDSSETSDGSNISNSDNFNSSFATEENDDVDGYDEISFHDGDCQDDSIIFAEDSEELRAQTKKVLKNRQYFRQAF